MLKKATVVMLATNQKAPITIWNDIAHLTTTKQDSKILMQHLYFLSDDEIKEGDWAIFTKKDNEISQCVNPIKELENHIGAKKIVATTDTSLKISRENSHLHSIWKLDGALLPEPSKSFIEVFVKEYNKGNVIKEVMVEYEKIITDTKQFMLTHECCGFEYKLKVNPKDNCITIKPVKDSWNRKEVEQLCFQAYINFACVDGKVSQVIVEKELPNFKNWIEQNI